MLKKSLLMLSLFVSGIGNALSMFSVDEINFLDNSSLSDSSLNIKDILFNPKDKVNRQGVSLEIYGQALRQLASALLAQNNFFIALKCYRASTPFSHVIDHIKKVYEKDSSSILAKLKNIEENPSTEFTLEWYVMALRYRHLIYASPIELKDRLTEIQAAINEIKDYTDNDIKRLMNILEIKRLQARNLNFSDITKSTLEETRKIVENIDIFLQGGPQLRKTKMLIKQFLENVSDIDRLIKDDYFYYRVIQNYQKNIKEYKKYYNAAIFELSELLKKRVITYDDVLCPYKPNDILLGITECQFNNTETEEQNDLGEKLTNEKNRRKKKRKNKKGKKKSKIKTEVSDNSKINLNPIDQNNSSKVVINITTETNKFKIEKVSEEKECPKLECEEKEYSKLECNEYMIKENNISIIIYPSSPDALVEAWYIFKGMPGDKNISNWLPLNYNTNITDWQKDSYGALQKFGYYDSSSHKYKKAYEYRGYVDDNEMRKFIKIYHTFPAIVDKYLLRFGHCKIINLNQENEKEKGISIIMNGRLKVDGDFYYGFFCYIINMDTKLCFHRCFHNYDKSPLAPSYKEHPSIEDFE